MMFVQMVHALVSIFVLVTECILTLMGKKESSQKTLSILFLNLLIHFYFKEKQ